MAALGGEKCPTSLNTSVHTVGRRPPPFPVGRIGAARHCRRRSAAGLALPGTPAHAALKTPARIVIAGSGLGGLAIAARVARELGGARNTVIDRKEIHNYQPGYTLVPSGIWPVDKVSGRNADLMPAGVEWILEMIAEFDPVANAVVTDGGSRIEYDYLVMATGLHLDYAQIEGMDVAAIGSNGLGSVYPGPAAAGALATVITFFITPGMTRSSFDGMGYWVDWMNLFFYAAAFLRANGFPNARYVVDGFQGTAIKDGPQADFRLQNGWQNSGLPWSPKMNPEKIHRIDPH